MHAPVNKRAVSDSMLMFQACTSEAGEDGVLAVAALSDQFSDAFASKAHGWWALSMCGQGDVMVFGACKLVGHLVVRRLGLGWREPWGWRADRQEEMATANVAGELERKHS